MDMPTNGRVSGGAGGQRLNARIKEGFVNGDSTLLGT